MLKAKFLRREYKRVIQSGTYVWSGWRVSYERFEADLWDRTPTRTSTLFLVPKDAELGFAPDNVEYHYRPSTRLSTRVVKPKARTKPKRKPVKPKAVPSTPEQKKQAELAAREARRAKLVEEFKRWEQVRQARR
jgi:hypothetical protein